MKRQHQITVQRAENGFVVISQGDELSSRNKKLIAKDESEVKTLLADIVNNDLFAIPNQPVKPGTPVA